jgi:hypothetical protein
LEGLRNQNYSVQQINSDPLAYFTEGLSIPDFTFSKNKQKKVINDIISWIRQGKLDADASSDSDIETFSDVAGESLPKEVLSKNQKDRLLDEA